MFLLNICSYFAFTHTNDCPLCYRLLGKMMPTGNHLLENRRKARQVVTGLGMDYDRIHACVNDCVLFHNEHAGLDVCPKCGEPRYKEGMQGTTIPRKVLRHFPLIPRIQHMFRSRGTSELLTWHSTSRSNDGVMRVPVLTRRHGNTSSKHGRSLEKSLVT